jgi:predicted DNA-binding transcriptional regulator YafY
VKVSIESIDDAARTFLAFGNAIEVLGPPELRERLAALAHATAALY